MKRVLMMVVTLLLVGEALAAKTALTARQLEIVLTQKMEGWEQTLDKLDAAHEPDSRQELLDQALGIQWDIDAACKKNESTFKKLPRSWKEKWNARYGRAALRLQDENRRQPGGPRQQHRQPPIKRPPWVLLGRSHFFSICILTATIIRECMIVAVKLSR